MLTTLATRTITQYLTVNRNIKQCLILATSPESQTIKKRPPQVTCNERSRPDPYLTIPNYTLLSIIILNNTADPHQNYSENRARNISHLQQLIKNQSDPFYCVKKVCRMHHLHLFYSYKLINVLVTFTSHKGISFWNSVRYWTDGDGLYCSLFGELRTVRRNTNWLVLHNALYNIVVRIS